MKKKERKTKTSEILKYMRSHKCISDRVARDKFGATRLGSIIYNLRRKGYDIETVICYEKDRYGNTCSFAKYYLRKEAA